MSLQDIVSLIIPHLETVEKVKKKHEERIKSIKEKFALFDCSMCDTLVEGGLENICVICNKRACRNCQTCTVGVCKKCGKENKCKKSGIFLECYLCGASYCDCNKSGFYHYVCSCGKRITHCSDIIPNVNCYHK